MWMTGFLKPRLPIAWRNLRTPALKGWPERTRLRQ